MLMAGSNVEIDVKNNSDATIHIGSDQSYCMYSVPNNITLKPYAEYHQIFEEKAA